MPRIFAAGLASLLLCVVPVHAQSLRSAPVSLGPSAEDWKAATDTRIEITKIALQLTPAQEKFWPAVEEAIRARAAARQQRLAALAERLNGTRETSAPEMLKQRADALSQRGTTLRKLAEAWQPLAETLDARQKLRLRFLMMYSLREVRDQIASKFEDADESEEW